MADEIDAIDEYRAFTAWWRGWVPDNDVPGPASHIFDAWMASARHHRDTPEAIAQPPKGDR